jgi:hypothetical protein
MYLWVYKVVYTEDKYIECFSNFGIEINDSSKKKIFEKSWMYYKKYKTFHEPDENNGIFKIVYIVAKKEIGIYDNLANGGKGLMRFPTMVLGYDGYIEFKKDSEIGMTKVLKQLINGEYEGHTEPFLTNAVKKFKAYKNKKKI